MRRCYTFGPSDHWRTSNEPTRTIVYLGGPYAKGCHWSGCECLSAHVMFAQADECVAVLQLTGNNITIRESKDASTSAIAQQFCDEKYQFASSSERQSIEASYKVFSASYGSAASSVDEFRSKYCSAGQQTFTSDRSVSEYARQSYAAAVEAWKSCDQQRKANVLIVPAGDEHSITYTITNRTGHPEDLTAVISSPPSAFSCRAISAHDAPTITGSARFPLAPGSRSLCRARER